MTKSRMETLEEFVREQPNDSFAHYGLALEYVKAGRGDHALGLFQKLLGFNPAYTAAYYQAGVLLGRLGRVAEARTMFQRGIEVAAQNGDFHTKSELEQALHDLPA